MYFLVTQGLGVVALLISIVTYQYNKKKKILLLQVIYNMLYGIQYFLLGSLSSMFICIIGACRNITFYHDDKIHMKTKYYILSSFILLFVLIMLFTYNGCLSILSCGGAIFSTFAVFQRREKYIRFFSLFSAIIWLLHDILIGSYAATLDSSILIGSIIIGIYRYDIKKDSRLL